MKRLTGSTHPPFKLKLRPGTKVSDVLAYLHLGEDYVLTLADDPTKHFFSEEDFVWTDSPGYQIHRLTEPASTIAFYREEKRR
jgi:hypothetical protein